MSIQNRAVPSKWKKYLLLEEYGLLDLAHLQDVVRRYPREDEKILLGDLGKRIREDEESLERAFYVVKLVPLVQQGQLPNYRIYGQADLDGLPRFFDCHKNGGHVETWYCRTAVSNNLLSTAGRIIFLEDGCQVVEHVDGCSPRLIESFSAGFKWPFIRASRRGWGRRFTLDRIYVPEEYRADPLPAFWQTMFLFAEQVERIRSFCDHLGEYFETYSLEYKSVGELFSIIDWDTPNDLEILH